MTAPAAKLQNCGAEQLRQILADPATPVPVLELAATRLAKGREDLLEYLLVNPALPERLQDHIVSELASLSGPSLELAEEAVAAVEPATVAAETASARQPARRGRGQAIRA